MKSTKPNVRVMCPNMGCRRINSFHPACRGLKAKCRLCGTTMQIPVVDAGTEARALFRERCSKIKLREGTSVAENAVDTRQKGPGSPSR